MGFDLHQFPSCPSAAAGTISSVSHLLLTHSFSSASVSGKSAPADQAEPSDMEDVREGWSDDDNVVEEPTLSESIEAPSLALNLGNSQSLPHQHSNTSSAKQMGSNLMNDIQRQGLIINRDSLKHMLDHPGKFIVHYQLPVVHDDACFKHPQAIYQVGTCQRR